MFILLQKYHQSKNNFMHIEHNFFHFFHIKCNLKFFLINIYFEIENNLLNIKCILFLKMIDLYCILSNFKYRLFNIIFKQVHINSHIWCIWFHFNLLIRNYEINLVSHIIWNQIIEQNQVHIDNTISRYFSSKFLNTNILDTN